METLNFEYVSPPSQATVHVHEPALGYSFSKITGGRDKQEDAAYFKLLPLDIFKFMNPSEIARRLLTIYRTLDKGLEEFIEPSLEENPLIGAAGTTALMTIYDGNGHLVTATLGTSTSFMVMCDADDQVLDVKRLNRKSHSVKLEKHRLEKAGAERKKDGSRIMVVINGQRHYLAVARALGDHSYRHIGVCAEGGIDIVEIPTMVYDKSIATIRIIACSKGFTAPCGTHAVKIHEDYLKKALSSQSNTLQSPAETLVEYANANGSGVNTAVTEKSFEIASGQPFCTCIFDGHGGDIVSQYVADNISDVFERIFRLSPEEFDALPLSRTLCPEAFDAEGFDLFDLHNNCRIIANAEPKSSEEGKRSDAVEDKEVLSMTIDALDNSSVSSSQSYNTTSNHHASFFKGNTENSSCNLLDKSDVPHLA